MTSDGFTLRRRNYDLRALADRHECAGAGHRARTIAGARWTASTAPADRPLAQQAVGFDNCGTTVTGRNRVSLALANIRKDWLAERIDAGAERATKLANLGLAQTVEDLTLALHLAVAQLDPEAPPLRTAAERKSAQLGTELLQLLPGWPDQKPTPGRLRKLARRAIVLSRRDRTTNPPDKWHRRRARSVRRDRLTVVQSCGTKWARIHCGCTAHLRPVACDQREMCDKCGDKWRRRILGRLLRATRAHEKYNLKAPRGFRWGRTGRWAMLSLSVSSVLYDENGQFIRHRTIAEQRDIMVTTAWPRWRAWIQKRTGRSWPYAWVPEVTDGDAAAGHGRHPHLHAVIMLPVIPFEEMAAAWVAATGGAAGAQGFEISTSGKVNARNSHDQRDNSETPLAAAKNAAQYICKYASKGLDCAPETAAEYWEAMYGKRRVSTSQGFWVQEEKLRCPDCGCTFTFDGVQEQSAHGHDPKQSQAP